MIIKAIFTDFQFGVAVGGLGVTEALDIGVIGFREFFCGIEEELACVDWSPTVASTISE